jgi:hypothetical protein
MLAQERGDGAAATGLPAEARAVRVRSCVRTRRCSQRQPLAEQRVGPQGTVWQGRQRAHHQRHQPLRPAQDPVHAEEEAPVHVRQQGHARPAVRHTDRATNIAAFDPAPPAGQAVHRICCPISKALWIRCRCSDGDAGGGGGGAASAAPADRRLFRNDGRRSQNFREGGVNDQRYIG